MVVERKARFRAKLENMLKKYKNCLIINVDFVGSRQLQQVRQAMRGKAELLMGKNTLIRRTIRDMSEENEQLASLLTYIHGNMGFIFSDGDLKELRDIATKNKVPAAAKTGTFAPIDVVLPAGPTGLDPGQTSFFQAMNISTKIQKGAIEILNPVSLIKKGERVSASAVALLSKLNKKPFFFGITMLGVYENGVTYDAEILDMTEDDLLAIFFRGVRVAAAVSISGAYPTAASLPHSIMNGFKKVLAVSLATEYTFPIAQQYKDWAKNGGGPAGGAAPAAAAGGAAPAKKEAPKKKEATPEEEDAGGGFSLFD